jgi:hypothetical protein
MNAVTFSAENATGIIYPAPCTNADCSKIHRLSKEHRLHENQLYIEILAILKDMGGGVHIRKQYYPDQKAKERTKRVFEAQMAKDSVPEVVGQLRKSDPIGSQVQEIILRAKRIRLAEIQAQEEDVDVIILDYTISLPEIEIDSTSALDILERLHQIYAKKPLN